MKELVRAKELHEEAKKRAKNYRKSETELIEILVEIDKEKASQCLGYSSLHKYCTEGLELSDSHSYALICVMRKSRLDLPRKKWTGC